MDQLINQKMVLSRVSGRIIDSILTDKKSNSLGILPCFLDPSETHEHLHNAECINYLHGRSFEIPKLSNTIVFNENTLGTITVKGAGWNRCYPTYLERKNFDIKGILPKWAAEYEYHYGHYLLKNGVLTNVPVAIIALENVIDSTGNSISCNFLKNIPYQIYRATQNNIRVSDLPNLPNPSEIFVNAMNATDRFEALISFTKLIIRNLNIIHKLGIIYHFHSSHNYTIAGELIDLENIEQVQKVNFDDVILKKTFSYVMRHQEADGNYNNPLWPIDLHEHQCRELIDIFDIIVELANNIHYLTKYTTLWNMYIGVLEYHYENDKVLTWVKNCV